MTQSQKQFLAQKVASEVKKTSQVNVSLKLEVSNATISNIVNGEHAKISVAMWRKVQKLLNIDFDWKNAQTTNYNLVYNMLTMAQEQSLSIAISDDAGKGKTHAFRQFQSTNANVIHIECKNYWSKKAYIEQLLINAGYNTFGTTQSLIKRFVNIVRMLDRPLIIIDQFDKLKDPQLDLFMDFYNDLNHQCGFVLSGVKALEKRILSGVNRDKIGYQELYSRIGRKFIALDPLTATDVEKVATENGITDPSFIKYMYENSEGDLRRVRRDINLYKTNLEKQSKA